MARPRLDPEQRKVKVTIRLDREVLEFFRASGRGWQTRIAEVLARSINRIKRKATP